MFGTSSMGLRWAIEAPMMLDKTSSTRCKLCRPQFQETSQLYSEQEVQMLLDNRLLSIQMDEPPLLVQSIMPGVAKDFRPVRSAAVGQIQYFVGILDAFETVGKSQVRRVLQQRCS